MNLSNKPLAMAYVPWQEFENVLDAECGLAQATIFEDLIFPFIGSQAACQADCYPNRPQPRSQQRPQPRPQPNHSCGTGRRCGY